MLTKEQSNVVLGMAQAGYKPPEPTPKNLVKRVCKQCLKDFYLPRSNGRYKEYCPISRPPIIRQPRQGQVKIYLTVEKILDIICTPSTAVVTYKSGETTVHYKGKSYTGNPKKILLELIDDHQHDPAQD